MVASPSPSPSPSPSGVLHCQLVLNPFRLCSSPDHKAKQGPFSGTMRNTGKWATMGGNERGSWTAMYHCCTGDTMSVLVFIIDTSLIHH